MTKLSKFMLPLFSKIEKEVLNGLSIEELELRLRPENEKNESNVSSQIGFINNEERLIDILNQDYQFLKEAGLDYEQMANISNELLEFGSKKLLKISNLEKI